MADIIIISVCLLFFFWLVYSCLDYHDGHDTNVDLSINNGRVKLKIKGDTVKVEKNNTHKKEDSVNQNNSRIDLLKEEVLKTEQLVSSIKEEIALTKKLKELEESKKELNKLRLELTKVQDEESVKEFKK